MLKPNEEITALQEVIAKGEEFIGSVREQFNTVQVSRFGEAAKLFGEFRYAGLSVLTRLFGQSHHHTTGFHLKTKEENVPSVATGLGILQAAKKDIERGWLTQLRSLVAAELFNDFIEMAALQGCSRSNHRLYARGTPQGALLESWNRSHLRPQCKAKEGRKLEHRSCEGLCI